MSPAALRFLADIILVLHVGVVLFVVGGLVLVVVGNLRGWGWVNAPWLRVAHLGAIAFVVAESWLGIACPLTVWESQLRERAGVSAYDQGFIEHWLQAVLFHDAPTWVFTLAYTVFGLVVAATWWRFPPRRGGGGRGGRSRRSGHDGRGGGRGGGGGGGDHESDGGGGGGGGGSDGGDGGD